ncbi:MAG: mannose-1-phosphate guanylyltransferase, partial [Bacteroidales bacterium]|nr:mannose-1-phosphate guanylyltransferase [Bacteroidales bacterium]
SFRIYNENPDAVMVVTPSDHNIKDEKNFRTIIEESFDFATEREVLMTLGIRPDRPETGYGYIQANTKKPVAGCKNLMEVKTFTEKPDKKMAKVFLKSGDFLWNSGIFIWPVKTIIESFERHLPNIYSTFDEYRTAFGTSEEEKIIGRVYSECSSISIDYGIMEKAENVYVKCGEFGWSDLGTWSSLDGHFMSDASGNSGDVDSLFGYDTNNSIIRLPEGKVAVVQGLKDYIIVDADNVLLIVKKEEEQNIKKYIENIREKNGAEYL